MAVRQAQVAEAPGGQFRPDGVADHEAVSRGAFGEELARFLTEDVVHRELPDALLPEGAVRDLSAPLEAARRGRQGLREQTFGGVNAVAARDTVAREVAWEGTLAVPLGDPPAGHVLRAHIGTFLEFRDGRIAGQRNYDCYEPLRAAAA
ncbi:nuclear transport factor 2 family protein [Streptomyces sp. NPDC088354]|uniref:nuclear transport factor 2 family protein n=1 Tax=unclassified Streptomyces TaxID=2593676 RepID=UPI0029B7D2EA|nr:nuclear transport factor 2 family protein [Streptomyces sp. MI02-7b]MDX3073734.1 nuclear transport factor 2 family protein [Streptomyces sp. MI02-7b]